MTSIINKITIGRFNQSLMSNAANPPIIHNQALADTQRTVKIKKKIATYLNGNLFLVKGTGIYSIELERHIHKLSKVTVITQNANMSPCCMKTIGRHIP